MPNLREFPIVGSQLGKRMEKERPVPGTIVVLLACLCGCHDQSSPPPTQHADTPGANANQRPPELSLDYWAFDQKPGQGWRRPADAGNYREAALLIANYLKHRDNLKEWQRVNLQFHAGQCFALAGDDAAALVAFRAALYSKEPSVSPIRWNAYVRATIAFLEKNREQLTKMRDEIDRGPEGPGTALNMKVVDRLIANFDKSYAEACGKGK